MSLGVNITTVSKRTVFLQIDNISHYMKVKDALLTYQTIYGDMKVPYSYRIGDEDSEYMSRYEVRIYRATNSECRNLCGSQRRVIRDRGFLMRHGNKYMSMRI